MTDQTTRAGRSNVSTIDDEGSPDVKAATSKKAADASISIEVAGGVKLSGKRALLRIASEKVDGGKDPVFVGYQGHGFLIPRDKDINCPVELVNVLNDARVTEYEQVAGGGVATEINRFAMSVRYL